MPKSGHLESARHRGLVIAAGLVGLVYGSTPDFAQACKLVTPQPHTLDAAAKATDTTAPGIPTASVTSIRRGKGPDTHFASCSQSASSCDDLGSVALQLSAQDDQTPADQVGYQIELTAGEPPSGMLLPTGAVRASGGAIFLGWNDGASDDQESVSFSLAIRAVDLAGNLGPATTLEVHDGGSGGCSITPSPLTAWPTTTLTILFLAYLLRRRRGGR